MIGNNSKLCNGASSNMSRVWVKYSLVTLRILVAPGVTSDSGCVPRATLAPGDNDDDDVELYKNKS